ERAVSSRPLADARGSDNHFHPAAAAGLEPAPSSVTGSCPTIGPHRKQSPRQDSNLRSPAPKAGALTRLRHSERPFPSRQALTKTCPGRRGFAVAADFFIAVAKPTA